jgi:hypothetical protein
VTAPAAVSLSNRRETATKNVGGGIGIDRLSISFPVRRFERDLSAWSKMQLVYPESDGERLSLSTTVDGCFVGVQQHKADPNLWIGKLECNPSRVLDPDGWEAIPVDLLPTAVKIAVKNLGGLVEPGCQDISESKLKRLDVCRDFVTEHPASIIRGLGPVHRPWSRLNLIHFDPSRNGAQTLMVGSRSGVVRLYDKHAEKDQAPEGTLRWEVEARQSWVQKYGHMLNLGDVTEDNVAQLAQDRWEWSAMDRELSGTEQVVDKVLRLPESPAVKRGLIGHLVMESTGCAYQLPPGTASKYRKLAKRAGLVCAPDGVTGASMRLDWDTGTEIVEVGF